MIDLNELCSLVDPASTTLLLGAGASMPSGAPSGASLARSLAKELDPVPDGNDLAEISGIYEIRRGRRPLVESVRKKLTPLEPSGGLLALPVYNWHEIYSTNFDQLVEKSYRRANGNLEVIKSNFDFSTPRSLVGTTTLFKIHGCISEDIALGNKGRLLLTERDYDELEQYRQSLWQALALSMTTTDTLILGQSLQDTHLRDLAKETARLRDKQGTAGRIFLLSYEQDRDRAQLLEQKGFRVAFGSLDEFMYVLGAKDKRDARLVHTSTSSDPDDLPPELATVTTDVAHAAALMSDAARLFNGSPATYADISAGLTIPRAVELELLDTMVSANGYSLVITGVAGVGKTCLARRLLFKQYKDGASCWEHRESYPLDVAAWLLVEESLRAAGRRGFLLIDNCMRRMTELNKLVEIFSRIPDPALRLVLTANKNQWQSRSKAPYFFSKGRVENLSILTEGDLEQLVNLVEHQPSIRRLVEQHFALLSRQQRIKRLRDRCSAEMYVCLKNIFGSERLDDILLREYAELKVEEQEIYRHVAVLQAMDAKVHRQLIIRLLNVDAGTLSTLLSIMEGIITEYDIDPRSGLFGWATRHDVIADVIATYKFTDQQELFNLLSRLIDGINPAVWLELETARAICTTEWGIQRLSNYEDQVTLLQKMISKLPAERTPRRRLIRKYLDLSMLDSAAQEMQIAAQEIGQDHIIDRYKVILALRRAEDTPGILEEDRMAMLQTAWSSGLNCVSRNPRDRHSYRILAEAGAAIMKRARNPEFLDEAIVRMREAEREILDPELSRDRRQYEQMSRNFSYLR
ncbi:SIR2 family protein [Actinomadura sp. WMMB 499]|uniref:SIR2 family protein n=1 Tax=Actinomadura sp. WMMB 499 TaxID=1219491 RepID=UPI001248DEBF|nr:SIR2 family protein [Actinomadura sp. WMMB 499]QFG21582.1 hypothetical protein F7P10_10980 [Actinomadura sp. WMMB 499]